MRRNLDKRRGKLARVSVVVAASLSLVIGLSPMMANATPNKPSTIQADKSYFAKLGWDVEDHSTPNFACSDNSYANAVKKGVTLGIYQALPFFDIKGNAVTGLDWDIHMAVLHYIGVTKYKTVTLQWPAMIPSLVSKKIDVIAGNIHGNPERYKNIAFTSPAWWYATVIVTKKGNPKKIASWADLSKPAFKLGALSGSQAAAWLKSINAANVSLYENSSAEFAALSGGRTDAIVEDDPTSAMYIKTNPTSPVEIVRGLTDTPKAVWANYARYGLRFEDCTLNYAYSRALSELRAHGIIKNILNKYGMSSKGNFFEPEYLP